MKLSAFTNDAAIDLGTANTRIYYKGTILSEPSVVAYDTQSGEIVAVGKEAGDMIGKNPETITVARPLKDGVITDFELACKMIQALLGKAIGGVLKPRVLICVPCGITDVERRAACDAVRAADIREVYVIESTISAAIGAACDVSLARGMMLADIGAGCCDISAISLGQTINARSVKIGGNDFTKALTEYILEKHSLSVGYASAERVKREIGCAFQRTDDIMAEIAGYNVKTRKPEKIAIRSEETREAFSGLLDKITAEIKSALDETPTELLGDIMEDGILLTGGGAQLFGLAKKLRAELGVKVFLAEEAELCSVRGAGGAAENLDKMAENTYVFKKG